MKILLASLLALSTVFSVHSVSEQPCDSTNCVCVPANYNSSVTPPTPTINCSNAQMTIYISKCQLEKSLFNTTNLSLISNTGPECSSKDYLVDGEVQVGFHNPMSSVKCGNNVTVNATHIIYSNTLYIYAAERPIITRNNASVNLSCAYPLTYPVTLNMTLKPITATTEISVPGVTGELTVTMAVFKDPTFTTPVTVDTTLVVEDTLYIRVWIPDLEANKFAIKVIRLYATPGATDPGTGLLYNLTSGTDGCPDPQYGVGLISVNENGNSSEARFTMKVFKITGQDYVRLYADVTICPNACVPNCIERDLSGSSTPDNVASVNMELTADDKIYSGASDRFSLSWTLVSLISLLFVKFL